MSEPERPVEAAGKRSCNLHVDCDAVEARLITEGKKRPFINLHCHNDECEECFGY
jgi:hypothetical protein